VYLIKQRADFNRRKLCPIFLAFQPHFVKDASLSEAMDQKAPTIPGIEPSTIG